MKRCKSSETRFAKVSCRSELCSRGKRPSEVSLKNRKIILKIFATGRGRFNRPPGHGSLGGGDGLLGEGSFTEGPRIELLNFCDFRKD